MTKKQKENKIYKELMDIIKYYLREQYPDLRKMPKQAKLRYKAVKKFYKEIAEIRVSNGSLPIGEY